MSDTPWIDLAPLRSPDSQPILGTTPEMLDERKVKTHINRAISGGRYTGPTDPLEYLHQKQCLAVVDDVLCATTAGILCFGREPQATFPRAVVDIGHYRGLESVSYDVVHMEKDIGGTVFDQIQRVETYLWTNSHHGMTIGEDSIQRVEIHEYPRVVIRELVVNMLVHRDYANFLSACRVHLFRNRIQWISPGGLPPGITLQNILTAQASRNPVMMSILHEVGYVEAFGQGLDTVVTVLRQENMQPPLFEDHNTFFNVTVAGRPLDVFYNGGGYGTLNERQRRILSYIRAVGVTTPKDIMGIFDERITPRSIQRDLKQMLDAELIHADGKGRAVRYSIKDGMP